MKRPKRLSASFVRTVNVPGRYGDGRGGHGLSLLVKPNTSGGFSKTFSQRLRIGGKPVMIGLGAYPVVTLARAREKALKNARLVEQDKDPRMGTVPTFEQAAEQVITLRREGWRGTGSETQWRAMLARYAFSLIGSKPVDKVDSADVLAILGPIWFTKAETARRLKQRLGAIMRWATVAGHRTAADPVAGIGEALPTQNGGTRHFASLPHSEVADALTRIRSSNAWPATKLCLELQVLTATRPSEPRLAEWSEVDIENRLWVIPPERTKANKRHRVPLSARAVAVLREAAELSGSEGLIFPAPSGKPISIATPSKLMKDLSIAAVAHGFRASFRSWAAEVGQPREVAEMALGHVVSGVEGSYQRSDLLDARRDLMASWAAYVRP
ncbi:tyrosine-type recombinase/integrase [Candidatus Palauibacter sp.]|uniref:tyrosine-type recombinase/integrase n=1 Tax=Candidatus Palauibacter sp. TaxID=3101350 RepID=UPI003C6FF4C9